MRLSVVRKTTRRETRKRGARKRETRRKETRRKETRRKETRRKETRRKETRREERRRKETRREETRRKETRRKTVRRRWMVWIRMLMPTWTEVSRRNFESGIGFRCGLLDQAFKGIRKIILGILLRILNTGVVSFASNLPPGVKNFA